MVEIIKTEITKQHNRYEKGLCEKVSLKESTVVQLGSGDLKEAGCAGAEGTCGGLGDEEFL